MTDQEVIDGKAELMTANKVSLAIPETGLPTEAGQLGLLYRQAVAAIQLAERIKAHVKSVLEHGSEVEGVFLRRGNKKTSVTNPKGAFAALQEAGLDVDSAEFLKCCSVSLPKLEQLYHFKQEDDNTQAESKAAVRKILDDAGLVKVSTGSPSVQFGKPENAQ